MWDSNRDDDATRHGRKGPGSADDLVKILSGLYKGGEGGLPPHESSERIFHEQPSELGKRSHAYLNRAFKGNCLIV